MFDKPLEINGDVSGVAVCENTGNIFNTKIENLIIYLPKTLSNDEIKQCLNEYIAACIRSIIVNCDYIERKTSTKNNSTAEIEQDSAINMLYKNKQVLLLADAGMGKSIESKNLAKQILEDNRFSNCIPVLLDAKKYPTSFSTIMDGIIKELKLYFESFTEDIVNIFLRNNVIALIVDGIDEATKDLSAFISEINSFLQKQSNSFVFITCRKNQYHNYFPLSKKIELQKLEEMEVRHILRVNNIIDRKFSSKYLEVFQNPFLLNLAVRILRQQSNKEYTKFYNKATLLKEFSLYLAGSQDYEKGIEHNDLDVHSVFMKVGEIAYNNFEKTSFTKLEFDKLFAPLLTTSKIFGKMRIEIFVQSDNLIEFKHRLFKEFFIAYYLNEKFSFSNENLEIYNGIVKKDEWIEVLNIISGLITDVCVQNSYLDYLLENNFKLFLSCLLGKNDLSASQQSLSYEEYSYQYLNIFYKTYIKILNLYFLPLKDKFNPMIGENKNTEITCYGFFSNDKKQFSYWFDREEKPQNLVTLLPFDKIRQYQNDFLNKAIIDKRSITTSSVNLAFSNLEGDTARFLAVQAIFDEIKKILKNRLLFESDYLLCEYIDIQKRKIKDISLYDTIEDIEENLFKKIDKDSLLSNGKHFTISETNGLVVDDFKKRLEHLKSRSITLTDYILPKPDQHTVTGYIREMYSKELMKVYISKFFVWSEVSIKQMSEANFPNLLKFFRLYNDIPYRIVCSLLSDKESDFANSYYSIDYYHKASDSIEEPIFIEDRQIETEEAFSDMENSYKMKNRKNYSSSVNWSVVDEFIPCHNTFPLANYVYKIFENEFKILFDGF